MQHLNLTLRPSGVAYYAVLTNMTALRFIRNSKFNGYLYLQGQLRSKESVELVRLDKFRASIMPVKNRVHSVVAYPNPTSDVIHIQFYL
ncbi:MAG TPA: hypothetical protein VIN07_03865, partial [Flavipsychrobacter sp.]